MMENRRGDRLRWVDAAKEATAEVLKAKKLEARARRAALLARQYRDERIGREEDGDVLRALSDMLLTSQRGGTDRALSVESITQGKVKEYRAAMLEGWRKAGVLPWLRHITPDDEAALAREIARLNGDTSITATTRAEVRQAAETVVSVQAKMREDMNRLGAAVEALEGRITRNSWDTDRLRRMTFEEWYARDRPRMADRTFIERDIDPANEDAVRKFLNDVWNNLLSGNHNVIKGTPNDLAALGGAASTARLVSEDRVIHWRSADDALAHNSEFGRGNVVSLLLSEIDHAARAVGAMTIFGPSPETALANEVARLSRRLADEGKHDQSAALTRAWENQGKINIEWRTVSGAVDIAHNHTAAAVGRNWRALNTVTSLGQAVLSSLNDPVNAAFTLRTEGVPFWSALQGEMEALWPFKGEFRREFSVRANAGMSGYLGGIHARFGFDQGFTGAVARGQDWFFRLNLQSWLTDSVEEGASFTLAKHIAENLRRDWAGMNPRLRDGLSRYGITEADWNVMRAAQVEIAPGGGPFFLPDMVDGPLRQRMWTYFADVTGNAITQPGGYEKALMLRGFAPGTAEGEALRSIAQFKSYPLTFITKHWAREWHRGGGGFAIAAGLGQLIAASWMLGYAGMTLKDWAAGRNARVPEAGDYASWAKVLSAAFVQGGGAGIYGDFLFGDFNRFGGSMWSTLAGPVAGDVEKIARMFATVMDRGRGDDQGNLAAQAVNFAFRDVLPTNLFYAKLILDHMIIFQLQEAVNPGYLRRLEQRVIRENDQTWWAPPTDALESHFGPFERLFDAR
jgi:hypothetical protein